MTRQGFDLQLTQYDREGWRATFYPEGRAHSVTQAVGSAYERTPWAAVMAAAWVDPNQGGRVSGWDAGAVNQVAIASQRHQCAISRRIIT
jgi:hypothetical protein